MWPSEDDVEVQRIGDRIVLSSDNERALNRAIESFEQEGTEVSCMANWGGKARFTAILTLKTSNHSTSRP